MYTGDCTDYSRLIVVCMHCRRILDHGGSDSVSEYLTNYSTTDYAVSHGICCECLLEKYPNEYLTIQRKNRIRIRKAFPAEDFYYAGCLT